MHRFLIIFYNLEVIMPFIALAIGVVIIAADQLIKYFVNTGLKPVGEVSVIDGLFKLVYVENRGVAFGMFKDMRWIFAALTSVLLLIIIIYMFKKRPSGKFFYICAGLIIGGGIGNLIDRVIYGYVIDYLSVSFFPPVCNFADYCITIGVILLVIYIFFFSSKFKSNKVEKND